MAPSSGPLRGELRPAPECLADTDSLSTPTKNITAMSKEPRACRTHSSGRSPVLYLKEAKVLGGAHQRDERSDIVHSQLKVFIPASWNHTQKFRDLGVTQSVQGTRVLKAEASPRYLA